MRRGRVVVAFLIGCVVATAVIVAVNVPVYHFGNWPDHPREYFGFWGVLFGFFAGAFAFGIALALLRREVTPHADDEPSQIEPGRKKVGLLIAAIVAGLFGLLVTSFNATWGVPLTSLEGAWLWPLAIAPLVISALLIRSYWKSRTPTKGT